LEIRGAVLETRTIVSVVMAYRTPKVLEKVLELD
jgi:hypothetical protein